jgi:hypothetical protein
MVIDFVAVSVIAAFDHPLSTSTPSVSFTHASSEEKSAGRREAPYLARAKETFVRLD